MTYDGRDRREYYRQYYQEVDRDRQAERYVVLKQAIRWYKESHPCVDCGESDPTVLQFDHLPEYEKSFNVGHLRPTWALSRIWWEIRKCGVVCGNCHLRRTWGRKAMTA